jgi:hypothetical protein
MSSSVSTRVTNIEGNYATTGSNIFLGAQTVCANITSTGTIIAQTLNVQQVTSSIVYSSGSNTFGNLSTDVQQMTGSVRITGSLNSTGTICSTGNTCFGGMTLVNSCLGIGTTAPATKLNIRSDAADDGILLEKSDGTDIARLFYDGTSTNARLDMFCGGSAKVQINTNGTSHFSGGNVGIGYNSPNYPLQVHSSTSISRIQLTNSSTGTASGDGFQIIADGVNSTLSLPENGYMSFETNNTERMRISNCGFVAVGVSPSNWCCIGHGRAIEVGCQGLGVWGRNFKEVHLINNYYYAPTTARTYAYCACASDYEQFDGAHAWYTAPYGSPGNAVTFNSRLQIFNSGIACFACQVCIGGDIKLDTGAADAQIILKNNASGNPRSIAYNVGDASISFNRTSGGAGATFFNSGVACFQNIVCLPTSNTSLVAGTYGTISNVGGIDVNIGNNAYYDGTNWRRFAAQEAARIYINRNSFSFLRKASDGAGSCISWDDTLFLAGSGMACFACQVCAPNFITTGTNSSVRGGDAAFFRGSTITQSGNNITFDAFRFLNPTGGLGGASSALSGRLYMTFQDTNTGGNQVSYQYLIITTGNGVSPGPYCFVQLYCGPVRGTNPISAISLVNDGAGGAVKVQATTAAATVGGAVAYITYVGTAV